MYNQPPPVPKTAKNPPTESNWRAVSFILLMVCMVQCAIIINDEPAKKTAVAQYAPLPPSTESPTPQPMATTRPTATSVPKATPDATLTPTPKVRPAIMVYFRGWTRPDNEFADPEMVFEFTNRTGRHIKLGMLEIFLLDAAGNIIDTQGVMLADLAPGAKTIEPLPFMLVKSHRVASYQIEIDSIYADGLTKSQIDLVIE